ncbi:MAG: cysteine hydrolase family protein [Thermodesulfobacteriota bacterium]
MPRTALAIIDMQNDFVASEGRLCIAGAQDTVPQIRKVLEVFREQEWPVFHIQRSYRPDGVDTEWPRQEAFARGQSAVTPGSWGAQIVDELTPKANEYVVTKKRFSAFMHTEFDLLLRRLHISDVTICGTQLPVCVRCTVFDAIALDYRVTLLTDATSAQTPAIATANIQDMAAVGAFCLSTAAHIRQLNA